MRRNEPQIKIRGAAERGRVGRLATAVSGDKLEANLDEIAEASRQERGGESRRHGHTENVRRFRA